MGERAGNTTWGATRHGVQRDMGCDATHALREGRLPCRARPGTYAVSRRSFGSRTFKSFMYVSAWCMAAIAQFASTTGWLSAFSGSNESMVGTTVRALANRLERKDVG